MSTSYDRGEEILSGELYDGPSRFWAANLVSSAITDGSPCGCGCPLGPHHTIASHYPDNPYGNFPVINDDDDDTRSEFVRERGREWDEVMKTVHERGFKFLPLSLPRPKDYNVQGEVEDVAVGCKAHRSFDFLSEYRRLTSSNSSRMVEKRKDKQADVLSRTTTEHSDVNSKKKTSLGNIFSADKHRQLSPRSRKALKSKNPSGNEANILSGKQKGIETKKPIWKY